jgi:tRNA-Thr(GGU) m(6)t(6)A37 methyltransferase TsaA
MFIYLSQAQNAAVAILHPTNISLHFFNRISPMPDSTFSPSPRPGEMKVALPAQFDCGLYFIGTIVTPWKERQDCPKNGRESAAICTIHVAPPFVAGLQDIEECSHLWVLYYMDRAPRDIIVQRPHHYRQTRGVFALRSPARPNPIALSAVKLIAIDRSAATARLSVIGLDCLDGTPLLDLKPYFASTDAHSDATVGWPTRARD